MINPHKSMAVIVRAQGQQVAPLGQPPVETLLSQVRVIHAPDEKTAHLSN